MRRYPLATALATALAAAAAIAACRTSPATRLFSLTPTHGQTAAYGFDGTIEVAAVHIPGSLDRQQILREGEDGLVIVSDRNRWAAPLDEMVREVLTRDLARRLPPGKVVLPEEPAPVGTRRIVLDVVRFAAGPSGRVVLTAGWTLLPAGSDEPLVLRQVRLSDASGAGDYASQVAAMSRLLGRLADAIAHELNRLAPG
jgi:uncharacterized protein